MWLTANYPVTLLFLIESIFVSCGEQQLTAGQGVHCICDRRGSTYRLHGLAGFGANHHNQSLWAAIYHSIDDINLQARYTRPSLT